jgi:hypothetical protein
MSRSKVWFGLSSPEDKSVVLEWLDENCPDRFVWYWVPASARRRVEFEASEDANHFREFLQNEGLVIYEI